MLRLNMQSGEPKLLVIGEKSPILRALLKHLKFLELGVAVWSEMEDRSDKNCWYLPQEVVLSQTWPYVLDLVGEKEKWEKLSGRMEVLSVLSLEDKLPKDREFETYAQSCRWIVALGVYGDWTREEGDWLSSLCWQAVQNKELELPPGEVYLLEEQDLVEAATRLTFFSGVPGGEYVLLGVKTGKEELENTLWEAGKMTTRKSQTAGETMEWNVSRAEETARLIRWEAKIRFAQVADLALQPYFSALDGYLKNLGNKKIEISKPKMVEKYKSETVEPSYAEASEGKMETLKPAYSEATEGEAINRGNKETKEEGEPSFAEASEGEEWGWKKIGDSKQVDELTSDPAMGGQAVEQDKQEGEIVFPEEPIVQLNNLPKNTINSFQIDRGVDEEIEKIINKKETDPGKRLKMPSININLGGWGKVLGMLGAGVLLVMLFGLGWLYWQGRKVSKVWEGVNQMTSGVVNQENTDWEKNYKENYKSLQDGVIFLENTGLASMGITKNIYAWEKTALEAMRVEPVARSVLQDSRLLMKSFWGEGESETKPILEKWLKEVASLDLALGGLEARLSGQSNFVPKVWQKKLEEVRVSIKDNRLRLQKLEEAAPVLREMLAVDGKRREFLVLLQNEMELRPAGGFIGSYAVVSVEDGKLINTQVQNVYETDGQLAGFVEPPAAIKNYLGEPRWFMRDANWSPHFLQSAKDIRWFYEKSTGRKVDGVIGVNIAAVGKLLEGLGEVTVPNYNAKVTSGNLYEQAQYYAEKNNYAGSKQKQGFLGELALAILENLKTATTEKQAKAAGGWWQALEEREVQVAINEPGAALALANLRWDGALAESNCSGACVADYVLVNEANVGVNKANFFVYRKLEQEVIMGEREVNNNIRINWENTARNNSWPAGDYKVYVRVLIPKQASLKEVWIKDGENETIAERYQSSGLDLSELGDKKVVGFLATVGVGKKRVAELSYSLPVNFANQDTWSYLMMLQKQSGYGAKTTYNLKISWPDSWQITQATPKAYLKDGKIIVGEKLSKDWQVGLEWQKK